MTPKNTGINHEVAFFNVKPVDLCSTKVTNNANTVIDKKTNPLKTCVKNIAETTMVAVIR